MDNIVKIGIIGFGFMGHCHADMLRSMQGYEVVAVCDTDEKQLEFAKNHGLAYYTDADSLLLNKDINTVIIAVPNHLHREMVIKSAKAGKHIICEKPVAMNVAELDDMIKAAEENNVLFTVHHQRRWDKDYRIAKEVFDKHMVGDIFTIKSSLYGVNGRVHDWHVFKKYGGGMMFDWGVHLIDQILNMIPQKITSVYADVKNVINDEVDDYFKIILKFESGIVAEIELGTYFLTPKRGWFIGGNTGSMVIDDFDCSGSIVRTSRLLENVPGQITMSHEGPTRSFGPPADGVLYKEALPEVNVSHTDYFKHFLAAFNGKEELKIKISEVRRVLSLMEAIHKSSDTGTSISFE